VALLEQNGALLVTTLQGGSLGRVEDQLSGRLTRLMQSGNEYRAGVVGVDGRTVRVIIRETQQAPDNAGRISFPPRVSQDSLLRPYVKEGLLRRSGDEDEDDDVDMEGDSDTDDEEEDTAEFGFHEGTLGES